MESTGLGPNPGSHTYKLHDLGQTAWLLSLCFLIYSGNNTNIPLKGLLYHLHEMKYVKYLAQSMVSAQINGHHDDDCSTMITALSLVSQQRFLSQERAIKSRLATADLNLGHGFSSQVLRLTSLLLRMN